MAMRWAREGEKLQAEICVFWDKRDGGYLAPFCEVQEVSGKMVVCYNSHYYGQVSTSVLHLLLPM